MIFPIIKNETIVQVGDKTRIDVTGSFVSKGSPAIDSVKIEPESGAGLIDITGTKFSDWFLDWAYDMSGTKTVTVEINDGVDTITKVFTIQVVTEVADGLWSNDQDLIAHEYDILKWIPQGKSSWTSLHRKAQEYILDWLNSLRIWKKDGSKLTKEDLPETDDLKQLSKYWTLELIFGQLSNRTDDVFQAKRLQYQQMRQSKQNTNYLAIDEDGDGNANREERVDLRTTTLYRR